MGRVINKGLWRTEFERRRNSGSAVERTSPTPVASCVRKIIDIHSLDPDRPGPLLRARDHMKRIVFRDRLAIRAAKFEPQPTVTSSCCAKSPRTNSSEWKKKPVGQPSVA